MSSTWGDVRAGFDSDEETVNFGPRHVVDAQHGSFECVTVATFGSSGQEEEVEGFVPSLKAISSSTKICVAVDKSLSVFDNSDKKANICSLKLDTSIECLALSKDSKYLFVCSRSGRFSILQTAKSQSIYSCTLTDAEKKGSYFIQILLKPRSAASMDAFVVCRDGAIYCIYNINLEQCASNADSSIQEKHYNKQKSEPFIKEFTELCPMKVNSAVLHGEQDFANLIIAGDKLVLCDTSEEVSIESCLSLDTIMSDHIIKLQVSESPSLIYALHASGSVWGLCPYSLMYLSLIEFDSKLDDFILMEDLIGNKTQILTSLKSEAEDCYKSDLKLYNFSSPGLECIFNIQVDSLASFVPSTTLVEDTLFLEQQFEGGLLAKILLKTVAKSQPEFRLQRLLRQRQFKEAINFAMKNDMDLQIVYVEEAKNFVQHLSPWASNTHENEDDEVPVFHVSELIKLLDKITDVHFVVECCLNALASDILQIRELLAYARTKIFEQPQMCYDLHKSVCQLIQRLDTFENISDHLDAEAWINFSQTNLLEICSNLLQMNALGFATEVWVRHEAELLNLLPDGDITLTLNLIPDTAQLETLLAWLNAFIPSVLSKIPDKLFDIINWLNEKIETLEFDYAENWPKIALDFSDNVMHILQPSIFEGAFEWIMNLHQQHSDSNSPLQKLKQTRSALSDLHDLKINYSIKLSMLDYMQPDKAIVARQILSKAGSNKLESLVNNLLGQIIHENNLDIEEVIASYIESTTNRKDWWFWDTVPWEAEILTLISLLKNTERVLSCVFMVLKTAPVPWSKNLFDLVERYENGTHPLVSEIKAEREFLKVKLILKKYKLYANLNALKKEELKQIPTVKAIFNEGRPEMLSDALQLVEKTPEFKATVHSLYVEHLIQSGDLKAARKHLLTLNPSICIKVCEQIFSKVEGMVTFSWDLEDAELFVAFLTPTVDCLEEAVKSLEFRNDNFVNEYKTKSKHIKNCFLLKHKHKIYDAKLALNHNDQRKLYLAYVQDCLQSPSTEVLINAKCVANLLGLPDFEASLLLVESLCSADLYLLAAEAVSSFETPKDRFICKNEVEILTRVTRNILARFQKVKSDTGFLPVLKEALCTSLIYIDPCYVCEVLELKADVEKAISLMTHLQQSFSVHDTFLPSTVVTADPFQKWTFSSIYEDMPFNTENSCRDLQNLFKQNLNTKQEFNHRTSFALNMSCGDAKVLLELTSGNESMMSSIKEEEEYEETNETVVHEQQFILTYKTLLSESNDLLALKLVCDLGSKCMNSLIKLEHHPTLLTECCKVLLKKVLSSRKADLPLALALLQTLPKNDSTQWLQQSIKRVHKDCNHLTRLSQLSIDFSYLSNNMEHEPQLNKLHLIGSWGKTLQKLGVSNKALMEGGIKTQYSSVLHSMIQEKGTNLDISIISKFCMDFSVDFGEAVNMCLEKLILSWKPEVFIIKNDNGVERVKAIDYSAIMDKAISYANAFLEYKKKQDLDAKLDGIWDQLNFYHYEMYLCLLRLKSISNPNNEYVQTTILNFLLPYKRQIAPQLQEIEKWLRSHPQDSALPSIAKWRLPFPLFMAESRKIIEAEVNLQNYCIWLDAPTVLDCNTDLVCAKAIKNSINGEICVNNYEEWCIQGQDDKLISDIEECANKIEDSAVAGAVLDYVAKRIPPGLDKLTVTELTYHKIVMWNEDVKTAESKDLAIKVSERLMLYSTIHCLHEHGLGKPEYLKLAESPTELVTALYNHPSIVERARGINQHCPDINAVVDKIGPIQNLPLEKIRNDLLETWLLPEMMSSGALDESFVDTSQVWKQYDQDVFKAKQEAEENLVKTCYLIESGDDTQRMKFYEYLIGLTFSTNSGCSARIKRRALLCLFWLVPMKMISELAALPEEHIRNLAHILFFLSEIENLQGQLAMSVNDFENQNKPSIIESLWRGHSQNPQALVLMCQICMHYKIFKSQVWANLLSRMQQMNMIKELKTILPKLNEVAHSLCTQQFLSAWNTVLIAPFLKIENPVIPEQKQDCIESLMLLQACPLRNDMDMKQMFKLCMNVSHFDLAAIIMTLSSVSNRPSFLKELFELTTHDHLKHVLQTLKNYATLPVVQTLKIIEKFAADMNEKDTLKEDSAMFE